MPIHPQLAPILEYLRDNPGTNPVDLSVDEVRANHIATSLSTEAPAPEMARTFEITIPTRGGSIGARVYVPTVQNHHAIGVYLHGGGFVLGTLDSYDALARRIADVSQAVIVSVDYRLAPEHPFPAGNDDAEDAVRWVNANRDQLADSSGPLFVVGDSAGACLAAVVANEVSRDIELAGQVLLYPVLGPELLTESRHNYATGYFLDMEHLNHNYAYYLGDWTDHTDQRVTPLLAADLSASPTAIIVIAEYDPLRDEGANYAGLLEHFGVQVELLEAEGMPHSFFKLGALVPDVLDEMQDLGVHIRAMIASAQ